MSISPTGPLSSGSLTSAARKAVQAIKRINHEVEGVASNVAAGISTKSGDSVVSDQISQIAKIPALTQQAQANAKVFETANTLLNELASTRRF
jgi:sulfate adenylyltransferase subunit 1 (EFTu-like GTPase family)